MTDIFLKVLHMSITGTYIAAAIIIIRLFMKRLPKKYSYFLWIILAIRLICPFSFSSSVSIFNAVNTDITDNQMEQIEYSANTETAVNVQTENKSVSEIISPNEVNNAKPVQKAFPICTFVWTAGVFAMILYMVISYIIVKRKVGDAVQTGDMIFVSKKIDSPFVFGIVSPKIYLPADVPENETEFILAHERTHIKRGDHIVKLAAMLVLSIHWFNPLVWISYKLMTRDMELSCDEISLKSFDRDVRKDYAETLLNMSLRQNKISLGGILAFGESNIKTRIKSVLSARKTGIAVTVISVILVILAACVLLTNSKEKSIVDISEYGAFGVCQYTDSDGYSDVYEVNADKMIELVNKTAKEIPESEFEEISGEVSFSLRMYYGNECDGEYRSLSMYLPVSAKPQFMISDNITGRKFYEFTEDAQYALYGMLTEPFGNIPFGDYYSEDGNYVLTISEAQTEGASFCYNMKPAESSNIWGECLCYYTNDVITARTMSYMSEGKKTYHLNPVLSYNADGTLYFMNEDGTPPEDLPHIYRMKNESDGSDVNSENNITASWEKYFHKNNDVVLSFLDPNGINGESIKTAYIMPVTVESGEKAYSGYILESENYYQKIFFDYIRGTDTWEKREDYTVYEKSSDFTSLIENCKEYNVRVAKYFVNDKGQTFGVANYPILVTDKLINKNGQTYGSAMLADNADEYPDLIAAQGKNGVTGYVKKEDFLFETVGDYEIYTLPVTDKYLLSKLRDEYSDGGTNFDTTEFYSVYYDVPLYDESGENEIGKYTIGIGDYPYR